MLIETQSLSVGYGNHTILKDLNLTANAGNMICLIGTNASGKSTLLRTLGGLQKPLKGNIFVQEKMLSKQSYYERSLLFSFVLTDAIDHDAMTVFDLVSLGRFPYTNWAGTLSEKDKEMINKSIAQVNLTEKKDCYLHKISDGEKQRAIIAKALTQDTPLILLDEPTAHLDLPNKVEIMLLLRKLSVDTHKTIILSTHELDLAMQTADIIWLIHSQDIVIGMPKDLNLLSKIQQIFGNESFYFDQQDDDILVKIKKN
jgi:iron complex transport system ATP-binding protein